MKNLIIGIDPGKNTGLAIFEDRTLTKLIKTNTYGAIIFIQQNKHNIEKIIIEASGQQSHVWDANDLNRRSFGRRARNTGSVDGKVSVFEELCIAENIELVPISPVRKGKKWSHKDFLGFFPKWAMQTCEHTRDAAKVVAVSEYFIH